MGNVLRKEMADWKDRLNALIHVEMPDATDEEICWALSKEAALKGSNMLLPMFRESSGVKGWQAMQVNPRFYRSTEKTVAHAAELSALNENILIKMPVSTADIPALEECAYRGISVNGTVCFGIPQEYLDCCGEALFKKVYKLYKQRGYRLKLLVANNNSHFLWSRFLGGDILMTINPLWWRRMNGARLPIHETINEEVPQYIVDELLDKLPEYRAVYFEDGLQVSEFNQYGAFKRTMNEFFTGYASFLEYLRGFMLP